MQLKYIILFLLLLPLSFAQFFDMDIIKNYILPATILLVCAMLGIAWMLSDLFSNPQLKAWVKVEVRSVITGGVLIVLVYALFFGTDSFASMITGKANLNEAAQTKLDEYTQVLKPAYYDMIKASHYIGVISGFGYTAPTAVFYFSINFVNSPHTGVRSLQSMVMQGAGGVSQALLIYSAIGVLLIFFTTIVPHIILPMALALRFIPFTKKIGNSLIAMCIGAAIIFPISIILVGHFHDLAMEGILAPTLDFGPFQEFSFPFIGWFCDEGGIIGIAKSFTSISELGWAVIAFLGCLITNPVAGWTYAAGCFTFTLNTVFPMITQIYQSLFWIIALADYNSFFGDLDVKAIYDALAVFLEQVTYRVLMAYIDAILILILTIVTTKSVSETIGGEAYLVGIQRFIG